MADLSQVPTDQLVQMLAAHPAMQAGPPVPPSKPSSFGDRIADMYHGVTQAPYDIVQSGIELGARGLDATGLTQNAYPNTKAFFDKSNSDAAEIGGADPNSGFYKGGRIAGQIAATLPASELNVAKAVPYLGKLPMLAKVVNGAAQGATAAAATSNSSDAPLSSQLALGAAGGAALPVLGAGLRAAGHTAAAALGGITTGAGANSVKGAFEAGLAGGDQGRAFTDSMRGNTPWAQVVSDAKGALANMRAQRNAAYRSGMADISKDATVLSFDPVDEAMAQTASVKNFKGQDLAPKTAAVRQEVGDAISNWKSLPAADYHTPEGFDALKQKLGGIMESYQPYSPEYVVAKNAYDAVKGAVADQAPVYSKVMSDYSNASDQLSQIQKELSLGSKGNPNTALRKLQSVMRDNVNTSWGDRAKYAQTLADNGAPNLISSLSGQALSTIIPRGLAKYGDLALAAGGAAANPMSLAALPLASPRLVGEGAYLAGSAGRLAANGARGLFGSAAPRAANVLPRLAPTALGTALPSLVYSPLN